MSAARKESSAPARDASIAKTKTSARTKALAKTKMPAGTLGSEIRELILAARESVAQTVNAGLTMLYWQIGNRIRREILKEKRAEYGEEIVHALSAQLEAEFGRGFGEKNLRRMMQFAEHFPDTKIVATLSRQLGWSHFKEIIPMADALSRDFYAEMCRIERWSVRTLRARIQSMLFERTALSRKPEKTIENDLVPICIQRDTHDSLERRHEWKRKGASMACALQNGDGAKERAQARYSWSAGAMLPLCYREWREKTLSYQRAPDKSLYSIFLIAFQYDKIPGTIRRIVIMLGEWRQAKWST